SMQFLDTRGLSAVEQIGSSFFNGAPQLTHAYLSYLKNVKGIGDQFLTASALRSLDMSGMIALERIGRLFLSETKALKTINMCGMIALKEIDSSFLCSWDSLETILYDNDTVGELIRNRRIENERFKQAVLESKAQGLESIRTSPNSIRSINHSLSPETSDFMDIDTSSALAPTPQLQSLPDIKSKIV
ncbi:MAG: hypothetical protein Q8K36_06015, partial [Alphaproteobacteria bacterium]|nr:hypothetical protein [Alphaproteobacteria bacterium]